MQSNSDSSSFEQYPLVDATDHEILMHRDAHFAGLFSVMLDYYRQEGKGVQPEFTIERIERLYRLENEMKQNLAGLFLAAHEAQRIADARAIYVKLREIYEVENPKKRYPQLIADLILAEDEDPEEEIHAVVAEKDKIVPALIDLLKTEEYYDPLFPGFGYAPTLAAQCLAKIGDKRALYALFESFGQGDFFADDQILKALNAIGETAKEFLLRVVKGRPFTEDNERAAIALISFKDDPKVANECFELLKDKSIQKDPCLCTYLALASAGLQDSSLQAEFRAMSKDAGTPSMLKDDMKAIIKEWDES